MTAIAAMVARTGRPLDAAALERMLDSGRRFGPGRAGVWRSAAAAVLECRSGAVTGNGGPVPLVDRELPFVLAWDGRLDNREELMRSLDRVAPGANASDRALVLAAYRRWGSDFVERLVGDFALLLWDGRGGRLIVARDPLGVRCLHWALHEGAVLVASRIGQLLRAGVSPSVNDGMVGDFLAGQVEAPDETFFAGIMRVPPAHVLEVDGRGIHRRRYWHPERVTRVRYRRPAEYAEQARTLLRDAVRARLRGADRVGLLMSGGLDSTSVACLVQELQAGGDGPTVPLVAITSTFDELAELDERRWVEPLARRYGFEPHYVPGDALWTFKEPPPEDWDEPFEGPFDTLVHGTLDHARGLGLNVVLTGHGADLLFTGSPYYLTDLLLRGALRRLARELRTFGRETRRELIRDNLAAALPPRRRANGRPPPEWIDAAFARRVRLHERAWAALPVARAWRPSRRQDLEIVQSVQNANRLLWLHAEGLRRDIELRHPYFDLRLTEFLLAVPPESKIRDGLPKILLRDALADALPDSIRNRRGRTNFGPVLDRGLREHERARAEASFAAPLLAEFGYVDGGALRHAFSRYLDGEVQRRHELARAFRLELWLRRLHGAASPPLAALGSHSTGGAHEH